MMWLIYHMKEEKRKTRGGDPRKNQRCVLGHDAL